MNEKIFETAQGNVHYWCSQKSEDADWIVFLPGLTAGHHLFDKQIEYFAKRFNCLTWDAPGHVKSQPYDLNFTLEDVAKILHQILTIEQIHNPVMIGQSYGGYIIQKYLSLFTDKIKGFVSIDSCPLQKIYNPQWMVYWLKHTEGMYRIIPWRWLIAWSLTGLATTKYGQENYKHDITSYEKNYFCKLTGHGFYTVAQAIEQTNNKEPNCPTLLLCGENDRAGFTKNYNKQWSKRGGYELIMVPKSAHNSNADAPDFVNAAIDKFLVQIM